MLLIQTLKIWEQLWNQTIGGEKNNFDEHKRESLNCLNRLLVEIGALRMLPEKAQIEVKNMLLEFGRRGILIM